MDTARPAIVPVMPVAMDKIGKYEVIKEIGAGATLAAIQSAVAGSAFAFLREE